MSERGPLLVPFPLFLPLFPQFTHFSQLSNSMLLFSLRLCKIKSRTL
ncbi:hypothetical protein BACCAP_02743 [Pseudoflavonifractor capillosus ATCC 29799]|uniref:Uncharacterized protein n=1 Tax=Pseudoflavonifractor capillosus ATCC 29799 TaxID=411467 RepID=A6NWZ8_9FIRM|nr:hypothetical protein BACCAP_02743 [Pseudoflavonifractor capillosus ATCC 29799]